MRLRNVVLAASALAIPAGLVAGAASAAPATPVKFTGSISGNLSGKITISPPLTTSASTGPVKFTTTATLSKITGSKTQKGVTLTGGKWTAVVTAPKGTSCSTLEFGHAPQRSRQGDLHLHGRDGDAEHDHLQE